MGLNDVKNEILQEAEEEADRIIEEAEEEADEIISRAQEKADQIRKSTEEEVEEEKETLRQKEISNAKMQAKERKLEVKDRKIGQTFSNFRERLEDLSQDEKEDFFDNVVKQTEFEVGKVLGNEDFQESAESEGFDFEEIDDQGVILESEDGERRKNYTFDKIVEDFRDRYRKKVAKKLFE